jgi:hypothetical protein
LEPLEATSLGFSPDGKWLAVGIYAASPVQVWDLQFIRRRLRAMNLDWDLLPVAPGRPLNVLNPNLLKRVRSQSALHSGVPKAFRFHYPHTEEPGWRDWHQHAHDPTHWYEKYPSGRETQFEIVGRSEVEGDKGTVVLRLPDKGLYVFIPDKGSHSMVAKHSWVPNGDWVVLGKMIDIR